MIPFHFSGTLGVLHTGAAVIALLVGTLVLACPKGTVLHRCIGYAYVYSMVLVVATAFGIYELFGGFGVFHVFAALSALALVGGMYPVLLRNRVPGWRIQHLEVMSWSVVGLYAAFAAEINVRVLPEAYSLWVLAIAGGLITTVGGFLIRRRKQVESRDPGVPEDRCWMG